MLRCGHIFWLISLNILIKNLYFSQVHTALYSATICPYDTGYRENVVEIFSDGWYIQKEKDVTIDGLALDKVEIDRLGTELSKTVTVEFYGKEEAEYFIHWLELTRR